MTHFWLWLPFGWPWLAPLDWVKLLAAVAWPAVVVFAILYLRDSAFVQQLAQRSTKISGFGIELDLSPETARRVRSGTAEVFGNYRATVMGAFDQKVRAHDIANLHRILIEKHVIPQLPEWRMDADYRATLHVEDALFAETLYQLIDYYPRGGGRGRTFSMRFGIIGRAWRTGESRQADLVDLDQQVLVDTWAMTSSEAMDAGHGRKSFAAIILKAPTGIPVGVIYLDSKDFSIPKTPEFRNSIEAAAGSLTLTEALTALRKEMLEVAPAIETSV
jgi:hypothetical protein